eukprot:scaffold421289_cov56-Attheya_sp.AAC.3
MRFLFLVGEGNAVEALEGVLFRVTEPGGGRVAGGAKCLDAARVSHVGSATQINQIATLVDRGAALNFGVNHLALKGIVGKQLQGLFLGDHEALKCLLLLDNFGHFRLHHLVIRLRERIFLAHVTIIVKTAGQGRSNGESDTKGVFQGLSQHVGAGMPKDRLGIAIVKLEQLQLGHWAHQRPRQVPQDGLLGGGGVDFVQAGLGHGLTERVSAGHAVFFGTVVGRVGGIGDARDHGRVG